jgi:hypothetical protein
MKNSYTQLKLMLLIAIPAIFSACSNHVYAPALYHQDIAYMPKPASFNKEKMANYASAGMNIYSDPTYTNSLVSAQLNYNQGFVFNNANFAWGIFGVAGNYEKGTDNNKPEDFTDKFFGAVGGRMSANLFTKLNDRTDFRFIGFELAYSHEFGSYADFRQQVSPDPIYIVDPRTDLVSLGLTTEVVFRSANNPDIVHGIRGFMGGTFGRNLLNDPRYDSDINFNTRLFRDLVPRASYFINVKQFFAVAEIGNAFFIRAGVKF